MPDLQVTINQAKPESDLIIAEHFYQLWLDNNVAPELIDNDWQKITVQFIQQARQDLKFQAFIAQVESQIVGSISCQLFDGLYPDIRLDRKYGYIWNVYVIRDYRRQGIATELTKLAVDYLKSLQCTKAILHASPSGSPVYKQLGFMASNEMSLDLT